MTLSPEWLYLIQKKMIGCRIFILILLAVDWAEDPHFGQSALSTPMASSSCISLEFKQQDLLCVTEPATFDILHVDAATGFCLLIAPSVSVHHHPPGVSLLYRFMSIRR